MSCCVTPLKAERQTVREVTDEKQSFALSSTRSHQETEDGALIYMSIISIVGLIEGPVDKARMPESYKARLVEWIGGQGVKEWRGDLF